MKGRYGRIRRACLYGLVYMSGALACTLVSIFTDVKIMGWAAGLGIIGGMNLGIAYGIAFALGGDTE